MSLCRHFLLYGQNLCSSHCYPCLYKLPTTLTVLHLGYQMNHVLGEANGFFILFHLQPSQNQCCKARQHEIKGSSAKCPRWLVIHLSICWIAYVVIHANMKSQACVPVQLPKSKTSPNTLGSNFACCILRHRLHIPDRAMSTYCMSLYSNGPAANIIFNALLMVSMLHLIPIVLSLWWNYITIKCSCNFHNLLGSCGPWPSSALGGIRFQTSLYHKNVCVTIMTDHF